MKKLYLILGLILSFLSIVLAATIYYRFAYVTILLSLILGMLAFKLAKQHQYPKKPIQLIFIIAIIAISITLYKAFYMVG